jgi:hypothetical protein
MTTRDRNQRLEDFIIAKGKQPKITELQIKYLNELALANMDLMLEILSNNDSFLYAHGVPNSPLRAAFLAYLAAIDDFDVSTRAEFAAAEAYRETMLDGD